MDRDLEEEYFNELMEEEGLHPNYYNWLRSLSHANKRTPSFFITLALEDLYVRLTQGPDFPEEHAITHH